MLDHISLPVRDYARSRDFFKAVLAPLGYELSMDFGEACGFGVGGMPDFWIGAGSAPVPPMHIAFRAPDREAVDAFYRAALANGGSDNGKPGLRPHYHSNYYAAFVIDPDGNNVEAVIHQ